MNTFLKKVAVIALSVAFALGMVAYPAVADNTSSNLSHVAGRFVAAQYNWHGLIVSGNTATGSQTIILGPSIVSLPDGRQFSPFGPTNNFLTPITMDLGAQNETVTPTAVSAITCPFTGQFQANATCISFTGSFSFTHGTNTVITSGSVGAQEAALDAFFNGGGNVIVDSSWNQLGGTNTMLSALVPFGTVSIEDDRAGVPVYWVPQQSVATVFTAPTTLTATTVGFGINGANTTGGTYTGTSTYHYCIAYVDVMGNEGPCSADFSAATAGTGTTNQIGFAAPAAATGAVGYTAYISLAAGSYNLTYQVPITSTVCAMTAVETVTPACKVTNSTYGQTGSNAVVSALTVNTAPLHLLKTTASTTSAYIGTPSGRTTYAYAPQSAPPAQGLTGSQQVYAVATAAATTVPEVIATVPVPIGSMNYVGRQLCIAGNATEAAAGSTATVQNFEFLWDAAGSNTTGAPVIVGQLQLTATLVTANADFWNFQGCMQTTVNGSSVTAGTIQEDDGRLISTYGAGVLGNAGTEVLAGIGSLNLAGTGGNTQRVHVVWLHTTGTDGAGVQVLGLRAWFQ